MSKNSQRASYGIYVRFRRSRLPLRRGIDTLEHALAAAAALRASRFHDGGDVFVVKEPEGTIVELADAEPASGASVSDASEAPPSSDALQEEPPALPSATPSPVPRAASDDLFEARARSRLDALAAQLEQAQRAIARARAAQERFERAHAEAGRALRGHDGYAAEAAEAILAHRARLGASRNLSARSVASCERSATLIAERLEAARRSRPF